MCKQQELQLQMSLRTSSTLHMEVGGCVGRWAGYTVGAAAADVPAHLIYTAHGARDSGNAGGKLREAVRGGQAAASQGRTTDLTVHLMPCLLPLPCI